MVKYALNGWSFSYYIVTYEVIVQWQQLPLGFTICNQSWISDLVGEALRILPKHAVQLVGHVVDAAGAELEFTIKLFHWTLTLPQV